MLVGGKKTKKQRKGIGYRDWPEKRKLLRFKTATYCSFKNVTESSL